MSTYRERREARAERLREWAEKREARSAAAFQSAHERADMIPFGQPILVGHHSEKRHRADLGRIDSAMRRGVESARKAESMQSRAGNIESQLEHAIYSDDPDAIPALERRIAALEVERDRIKAFNASVRKGSPDESILTEKERKDLHFVRGYDAFTARKGTYPAYHLTNLSGNIKRNRDRLEDLKRKAARSAPPPPQLASITGMVARARASEVPGQMGLFRGKRQKAVPKDDLERERRRRVRQAATQRRRRDGRFR